jgi:hypothetical protein
MDLMESFRTLRRQWILASMLLLLTLAGTAAAAVKLPWAYQAVGTTVLLNSKNASAASLGNPLLAFEASLSSAAEVLSLALMSPHTAQALHARGYYAAYSVAISSVTGGPILQVTVTGSNKTSVENTLHGVMNEVGTQLLDLQPGVAQRNLIRALPLSQAAEPSRSTSKKAKPIVAVLGLGLVLTFAIPQIFDGLASRGQGRRKPAEPLSRTDPPVDQADSGRRSHRYADDPVPPRPGVRGNAGNTRAVRSERGADEASVTRGPYR